MRVKDSEKKNASWYKKLQLCCLKLSFFWLPFRFQCDDLNVLIKSKRLSKHLADYYTAWMSCIAFVCYYILRFFLLFSVVLGINWYLSDIIWWSIAQLIKIWINTQYVCIYTECCHYLKLQLVDDCYSLVAILSIMWNNSHFEHFIALLIT